VKSVQDTDFSKTFQHFNHVHQREYDLYRHNQKRRLYEEIRDRAEIGKGYILDEVEILCRFFLQANESLNSSATLYLEHQRRALAPISPIPFRTCNRRLPYSSSLLGASPSRNTSIIRPHLGKAHQQRISTIHPSSPPSPHDSSPSSTPHLLPLPLPLFYQARTCTIHVHIQFSLLFVVVVAHSHKQQRTRSALQSRKPFCFFWFF
jgi:hypothetical protein